MSTWPNRTDSACALTWAALFALSGVAGFGAVDITKLPPAVARSVDFVREVKPILEKNCYDCHGPKKQRSGYRLDEKDVALKGGESSAPNIVPGKSSASPLIHYVGGLDEEMLMPSKGDPLTAEQIGILRAWIDQGAVWPEDGRRPEEREPWRAHWAYRPLARPEIPSAPGMRGSNPVDAFVRTKLEEKGLAPSPTADRRTLIRRLTFDLIGLPPTPEEVETFLAETDEGAYSRLVERLLASPRYGERWARHWLDVVKFAESDGFERNNLRPNAWPYRDYVIRAFNDDKPYDRFVHEQLAGDALGADAATGFIVGGSFDFLQNFEPPLFNFGQRADELYEIVGTMSSAFMGLTVGCARCHDHKFDPIPQADYYALTAVFQGVGHGERPLRPSNHDELIARAAAPRRRVEEIDGILAPFAPVAQPKRVRVVAPAEPAGGKAEKYSAGSERGQAGDKGDEMRLPTLSESFVVWPVGEGALTELRPWGALPAGQFRVWISWSVAPEHASAVDCMIDGRKIAQVNQTTFADGKPGVAGERRWSGFHDAGIHVLTSASQLALLAKSATPVSADVLLLEEIKSAGDEKPTLTPHLRPPVIVKTTEDRFPPVNAKFVRFTVLDSNTPEGYIDELEVFTAGAQSRNVALAEFGGVATSPVVNGHDGNPFYINDGRYNERAAWNSPAKETGHVQIEFSKVELVDRILWSRNRSDRVPTLQDHLVTGYRIDVSVDGRMWTQVASSDDRLEEAWRKRVPAVPTLSFVPPERAMEIARLVHERRTLTAELKRLVEFPPVYAGKLHEPGPTYRLHRGDPLSRREQVSPGALSRLGPKLELPRDLPEQQRRVALGKWLTSPDNPMTARVMVNRIWHYHFGTGLVDTPSDFGLNGARPTHPELLDWLASEFMARGWRIKDMHRLIVMSETYRQSSKSNDAGLQADAEARYLWRFPPRRIEAEVLRDTMLAVSGRLDLRTGGPGFFLFEAELSRSSIQTYVPKTQFAPEDLRRMVYQLKPRAQLDDVFGAFDCPDAGQIAPSRTRSTTPLQAFNLLNSPFVMQQSAALAARLKQDAGADPKAQVQRAFQLMFGRNPAPVETDASVALITEEGLPLFCRALFNANEFIHVF